MPHVPYRPWPADKARQISAHREPVPQSTVSENGRHLSSQRPDSQRAKASAHPVQTQQSSATASEKPAGAAPQSRTPCSLHALLQCEVG